MIERHRKKLQKADWWEENPARWARPSLTVASVMPSTREAEEIVLKALRELKQDRRATVFFACCAMGTTAIRSELARLCETWVEDHMGLNTYAGELSQVCAIERRWETLWPGDPFTARIRNALRIAISLYPEDLARHPLFRLK